MDPLRQVQYADWLKDIEAQRTSGMTQEEWCQVHGMSLSTFKYRQRAIRKAMKELQDQTEVPAVRFAEVPQPLAPLPATAPKEAHMVIELSLAKITVTGGMSPKQIRACLEAILHAE